MRKVKTRRRRPRIDGARKTFTRTPSNLEFSDYQEAVFEWACGGKGNVFVNAVAGSGKSTTLVEAAHRVGGCRSAHFLAFNKAIAEELKSRLFGSSFNASTVHALGFKALCRGMRRKFDVKGNKMLFLAREIVRDARDSHYVSDNHLSSKELEALKERGAALALRRLADLKRLTGWKGELGEMALYYGVDFDNVLLRFFDIAVPAAIDASEWEADRKGLIDFTDMICLPVKWGLKPYPAEWLFIDEAQDINHAQMDLILSAAGRHTRMLFCGDPRQAIYGFSGAGVDAIPQIVERVDADELPLSICYRCPKKHIELAQTIVPRIEAHQDAPEGEIISIDTDEFPTLVRPGDLVLCRINAPLFSDCLALIREGIPAKVRGRDIGERLVYTARAIIGKGASKMSMDFSRFKIMSVAYLAEQEEVIEERTGDPDDPAIQNLHDRVLSARILWKQGRCECLDDFKDTVESIFEDGEADVVMFSTVHKAKGLESARVFVLQPDLMPLPARREWQREQEKNIKYVAYTRAKESLYFVYEAQPGRKPAEKES